jgi:ATP-dependent DNA helicase PIF1
MIQREALAILDSGASVLLTGAAGTGKTYTLNQFIRRARARGKNVAVTATTGLAATHLGGNTIHAWSGIGVHDELPKRFADKLSKQRQDLITKADILVIDEISMLHDFRLDMIDTALRQARGTDKPFGGLQIVLCGDFFQLPPVSRSDSRRGGFITSSQVWQQGSFTVCYLQEQFRQAGDDAYVEILNGIRKGSLMRSQLSLLQSRMGVVSDPFLSQTRLLTTNADVDAINDERLQGIESEEHEYEMETSGGKQYVETLKRSCLAPEVLRLKKGASVMCIKNAQDRKYVNGSLGEVIDFDEETDFPIVKLNNGLRVVIRPDTWELRDGDKKRASLVQLPLRLAWAITVHKSQGMTLDAARIDLSRAFVEGMGYVALSRVKDLRSLVLDGMNGMALRTSRVARQIDGELQAASAAALTTYANEIASWKEEDIVVLEKTKKRSSWTDKIAKMRETYPNAYMPWKEGDDSKLLQLHKKGKTTAELTEVFGRHPGSIEKRLEKLLESAVA